MEFHDIGAVVYFLRKVIWIVPGFTVERTATKLRALHERIHRGTVRRLLAPLPDRGPQAGTRQRVMLLIGTEVVPTRVIYGRALRPIRDQIARVGGEVSARPARRCGQN